MKTAAPTLRLCAGLLCLCLAGCAATSRDLASDTLACPAGQQRMKTAQLFFGRPAGAKSEVSDSQFRKFVDQELTPRFPDGLTVMDGGSQWRGDENRMIREAAKVVLIVLPGKSDASPRIDAARIAFRQRFHQDSVLVVTPPACVAF